MPLYDNPDQHGADPIAEWLDRPRGDIPCRHLEKRLTHYAGLVIRTTRTA